MREIKYRAWDKDQNRMSKVKMLDFGQWVVGDEFDYERNSFSNQETDRHILMQFTGLLDKNGVEIYESDLIKDCDSGFVGEVVWDEDGLCWTTKFENNELWGFVPHKGKDNHCEKIGNIYSNSGLLEE